MANIDVQVQLNNLLNEQNKLLAAQTKLQKSQLEIMKNMVATMGKMNQEESAATFNSMTAAIQEADKVLGEFATNQEKALKEAGNSAMNMSSIMDDIAGKSVSLGKKAVGISVLGEAFTGLVAGGKAAFGIFGSLLNVAGTLTQSMFSLATSIISIPFKAMSALMEEAASYSGGELRQAIEDLRKEMGDLSTNEGEAVMKTFRSMKEQGTDTGLSMYRVFGNMAERLREMTRIANAMGRNFGNLTGEFMDHGRQIGEYAKGLGLSEEGIKGIAVRAEITGKTFTEIGREITTMAYGMGDAFGINGKLISRDISEMIKDVENFGSVGVKEMSQIAVYTRKLGIEIKDLLGVVGQFDDFENAANSAAQLSQAFGIQVDTLELLKEQDPAARFESLRKAFLATGKSVESLTRQELSLLSAQTGVSAEALKLGFSQSKAGMSYEEIQKQADATEKKQLTQAEAMEKLSMSIELLVKSGEQMRGGFFDIFIQGFGTGVKRSEPFRHMMITLNRAMRQTLKAGREVGRMFVEVFPGVKDIFVGLREVFDGFGKSRRTSKGFKAFGFLADVVSDFRKFMDTVGKDPKTSLKTLFKDLQKDFFNFFDKSTPAGQKVLNGFKSFFKTLGSLFGSGVEIAAKGLTEGIKFITDIIKDPSAAISNAKSAQNGFASFLTDMFGPAFMAIKEQWPELRDALVGLLQTAWEAFKPTFEKLKDQAISLVTKMAIGNAIRRVLMASMLAGFTKLSEGIVSKGGNILGQGIGKMFGKLPSAPEVKAGSKQFSAAISSVGTAGDAMGSTGKGIGKINFKALGKNILIGIAAITAVSLAMAGSFVLINAAFQGAGVKQSDTELVSKVMGTMGMMFLTSALVIGASLAVGAIAAIPGAAPLILIGLAALAAVTTGMVTHTIAIIGEIDKISLSSGIERKVGVFQKVMGAMSSMATTMAAVASSSGGPFNGLAVFLTGRNPLLEGLQGMKELMGGISEHMKDIIVYVTELTKGMTSQQIQAGTMIGSLFESLAGIMRALMPPEELAPSFLDKLLGVPVLDQLSMYMSSIASIFSSQLVPTIQKMLTTVSAIPNLNAENINIFSSFIGGITSLLSALQPSKELVGLMQTSSDNSFWSSLIPWADEQKVGESATKGVSDIMSMMISALTGPNGVIEKVKTLMGGIVSSVGALGDPGKVKTATELFNSVIGSISDISGLFTGDKITALNEAAESGLSGSFLSKFNDNIISPMTKDLPAVLSSFDSISSGVSEINTAFVAKVSGGIKDMVAQINSVTDSLNSLSAVNIKTQLKQTADKLGLKGSEEFKIKLDDINLTINLDVKLETEAIEKSLITRPGGSKFVIKGS